MSVSTATEIPLWTVQNTAPRKVAKKTSVRKHVKEYGARPKVLGPRRSAGARYIAGKIDRGDKVPAKRANTRETQLGDFVVGSNSLMVAKYVERPQVSLLFGCEMSHLH
jgi:hypothetical protein